MEYQAKYSWGGYSWSVSVSVPSEEGGRDGGKEQGEKEHNGKENKPIFRVSVEGDPSRIDRDRASFAEFITQKNFGGPEHVIWIEQSQGKTTEIVFSNRRTTERVKDAWDIPANELDKAPKEKAVVFDQTKRTVPPAELADRLGGAPEKSPAPSNINFSDLKGPDR